MSLLIYRLKYKLILQDITMKNIYSNVKSFTYFLFVAIILKKINVLKLLKMKIVLI